MESEKPEGGTNKLSLLDFTVVTLNSHFFKKEVKKNVFVHSRSAIPNKQKLNILMTEVRKNPGRCSNWDKKHSALAKFDSKLQDLGYHVGDAHVLSVPFVNDKVDNLIKKQLRDLAFPYTYTDATQHQEGY